MFMRYRGGGIGHKYMREVETKYENMSLERIHGPQPKPSQKNSSVHSMGSSGEGSNTLNPPAEFMDGSQSRGTMDRGGPDGDESDDAGGGRPEVRDRDGVDSSESEDEDYLPPETGNSDDDYGPTDSSDDTDEIESDAGFESYGLADI
jgi:hypothetical protein